MPAHNEAASIAQAIDAVCAVLESAAIDYEIVVVSDGSTDATLSAARSREGPRVRVLAHTPNRGKGHALAVGSLVARGVWTAWLDSDLDLHPDSLPKMLERVTAGGLDAIVGSKRHPDSIVDYPMGRRIGSRAYQMAVRILFGLDVSDTQVGIKMFHCGVLQDVLPRVVVKRYAFDLEVLAVARHLGFTRIEEAPVVLDYQFSGSGVSVKAISRALLDTAAIFYRLRILRYYDE
jgi:glycosyltransferase involved in cell wall biosynthesis